MNEAKDPSVLPPEAWKAMPDSVFNFLSKKEFQWFWKERTQEANPAWTRFATPADNWFRVWFHFFLGNDELERFFTKQKQYVWLFPTGSPDEMKFTWKIFYDFLGSDFRPITADASPMNTLGHVLAPVEELGPNLAGVSGKDVFSATIKEYVSQAPDTVLGSVELMGDKLNSEVNFRVHSARHVLIEAILWLSHVKFLATYLTQVSLSNGEMAQIRYWNGVAREEYMVEHNDLIQSTYAKAERHALKFYKQGLRID